MGSGTSSPVKAIKPGTMVAATNEVKLQAKQKEMLDKTWKIVTTKVGTEEAGQEIFFKMLVGGQKIRQLFGLEAIPDEKLKTNDRFVSHANKLIDAVGRLVTAAINDESKFWRDCDRLAEMHFGKIKVGFNPMYWSIFPYLLGEVMSMYAPENPTPSSSAITQASPGQTTQDCLDAWATFGDIAVDIMQAAYIRTLKNNNLADDRPSLKKVFGFGAQRPAV